MSDLDDVPGGAVITGGRAAAGRGRRVGLAVLGLLLVTAIGVVAWQAGDDATGPTADDADGEATAGDPVGYVVAEGATVTAVGEDLIALGVIDSSLRFRVEADAVDLARVLRPGRFQLALGMEEAAAVAVLAAGPAEAAALKALGATTVYDYTKTNLLDKIPASSYGPAPPGVAVWRCFRLLPMTIVHTSHHSRGLSHQGRCLA